jgi:hypothetical protein
LSQVLALIYGVALVLYLGGLGATAVWANRTMRRDGVSPIDIRPLSTLGLTLVWLVLWPVCLPRLRRFVAAGAHRPS